MLRPEEGTIPSFSEVIQCLHVTYSMLSTIDMNTLTQKVMYVPSYLPMAHQTAWHG